MCLCGVYVYTCIRVYVYMCIGVMCDVCICVCVFYGCVCVGIKMLPVFLPVKRFLTQC